jgi:protein-disulfide isomerase
MKACYCPMIFSLILIILLSTQPCLAQPSGELNSLKKELEEIKESQKAIQKEIQEIKNLLRAVGIMQEEPKNIVLNIAGKPIKGNKNAKLTLIEFSEYQ